MVVSMSEQIKMLLSNIAEDICGEFGFPEWYPLLPIERAEDYPRESQKHVCRINGKVELQELPLRVYTIPCSYQYDKMSGEEVITECKEMECFVCPYCGKVILLKSTF